MNESILNEVTGQEEEHEEDLPEHFLMRIPEDVLATLSTVQKKSIRDAAAAEWGEHPVNVRFAIPLIFRNFYFTMVAGVCKRDTHRRALDRELHPLRTFANIVFVGGCAALVYMAVIGLILFYGTIIEY